MSANRDCRNVYPHLARFEGDVIANNPFRLPALPHRVWARRDSTLEDMSVSRRHTRFGAFRSFLGNCENVTSVAPVVDTTTTTPARRMIDHDRKRRLPSIHRGYLFRPIREEGRCP